VLLHLQQQKTASKAMQTCACTMCASLRMPTANTERS
jgi:hypothetical protein